VHATQRLMLRGVGIFAILAAVGAALSLLPPRAGASRTDRPYTGTVAEFGRLRTSLDAKAGQLELVSLELRRAQDIIDYSAKFAIPADLAGTVYDEALRAGLDPSLAFEIVRIESRFNPRALSTAGAIGLTQIMPKTAAFYDSTVTEEGLYDPATNLRIGFTYFRDLYRRYDGNLRTALLAYNRGPQRVGDLVARGLDPANGYAAAIISGYKAGGPAPN
jgi:soluble lytic murein transglycosylase-like protein